MFGDKTNFDLLRSELLEITSGVAVVVGALGYLNFWGP